MYSKVYGPVSITVVLNITRFVVKRGTRQQQKTSVRCVGGSDKMKGQK